MTDLSEVRRSAWETRRAKYGPQGHQGAYERHCNCCVRMRHLVVQLYREAVLSEGQAAKAIGIDRIELRKLADERANSRRHSYD